MPGLETGMVCIKTKGREAGKKVIVVEFDKKSGFATIQGKNVKKRKCNVLHLFPTGEKGQIKDFPAKQPKKKEKKEKEDKEKKSK